MTIDELYYKYSRALIECKAQSDQGMIKLCNQVTRALNSMKIPFEKGVGNIHLTSVGGDNAYFRTGFPGEPSGVLYSAEEFINDYHSVNLNDVEKILDELEIPYFSASKSEYVYSGSLESYGFIKIQCNPRYALFTNPKGERLFVWFGHGIYELNDVR